MNVSVRRDDGAAPESRSSVGRRGGTDESMPGKKEECTFSGLACLRAIMMFDWSREQRVCRSADNSHSSAIGVFTFTLIYQSTALCKS